ARRRVPEARRPAPGDRVPGGGRAPVALRPGGALRSGRCLHRDRRRAARRARAPRLRARQAALGAFSATLRQLFDGPMAHSELREPSPPPPPRPVSDLEAVKEVARARAEIVREIEKRIIGQQEVVDQLLTALFARGHCLFVGVPGLAKTLLISTLADVLDLSFSRIQFTPDLMPSDITGTDILEEDHSTGRRAFRFIKGPVFAPIVLADEINRTPPKTQAALLQSMQELRVTAGGTTHELPPPFLVFATQNPIEQEGTYPLPEAQLDRFMFQIDVGYPGEA